jgi:RHS repeat-associated protein
VVAVTSAPQIKGQSITVKWSGIATPTSLDWVGIYAVGSNDHAYLDWAYTNGGSNGTVSVTLNYPSIFAGNTYEARLYANDGYTLLAKTPSFTVVASTVTSPAALYFVHNDHLGTPQALTNQAGAVVWKATYDPFGQATVNEDPDGDGVPVKNNKRYAGMYFDAETGLHYNWHRYYDPKVGRYISSDPIGLWGGLNTFSYVKNNPLRWIDPHGLDVIDGWEPELPSGNVGIPIGPFGPSGLGQFRYHGNWCGPGWTGGQWGSWDGLSDQRRRNIAPPIDSLDASCKQHDMCYALCREKNRCDKESRANCMIECDRDLATNARRLGYGGGPLHTWMEKNKGSDPGENPSDCCAK